MSKIGDVLELSEKDQEWTAKKWQELLVGLRAMVEEGVREQGISGDVVMSIVVSLLCNAVAVYSVLANGRKAVVLEKISLIWDEAAKDHAAPDKEEAVG